MFRWHDHPDLLYRVSYSQLAIAFERARWKKDLKMNLFPALRPLHLSPLQNLRPPATDGCSTCHGRTAAFAGQARARQSVANKIRRTKKLNCMMNTRKSVSVIWHGANVDYQSYGSNFAYRAIGIHGCSATTEQFAIQGKRLLNNFFLRELIHGYRAPATSHLSP